MLSEAITTTTVQGAMKSVVTQEEELHKQQQQQPVITEQTNQAQLQSQQHNAMVQPNARKSQEEYRRNDQYIKVYTENTRSIEQSTVSFQQKQQQQYQHQPNNNNLRRRAEDVEYWRQRAGWFNDDESMKAYNNGIYDSYYGLDDAVASKSSSRRSRGGKGNHSGSREDIVKNTLKILSIVVALGLSLLMFRAIMRRMNTDRKEKKSSGGGGSGDGTGERRRSSSDNKSRSSSVKRSRSRSRSRRGEYDLMKDGGGHASTSGHSRHHHSSSHGGGGHDDESKSRRSSRSKSSSKRRSRSRSRSGRSRSKSRAEKPTEPVKEAVLV
jgi:hypothetical protein